MLWRSERLSYAAAERSRFIEHHDATGEFVGHREVDRRVETERVAQRLLRDRRVVARGELIEFGLGDQHLGARHVDARREAHLVAADRLFELLAVAAHRFVGDGEQALRREHVEVGLLDLEDHLLAGGGGVGLERILARVGGADRREVLAEVEERL